MHFPRISQVEQTIILFQNYHFVNDPQTDKERMSLHLVFRLHPYSACQVFL